MNNDDWQGLLAAALGMATMGTALFLLFLLGSPETWISRSLILGQTLILILLFVSFLRNLN